MPQITPLGPSGENDYFTLKFGRGVADSSEARQLGAEVPELQQKFPFL